MTARGESNIIQPFVAFLLIPNDTTSTIQHGSLLKRTRTTLQPCSIEDNSQASSSLFEHNCHYPVTFRYKFYKGAWEALLATRSLAGACCRLRSSFGLKRSHNWDEGTVVEYTKGTISDKIGYAKWLSEQNCQSTIVQPGSKGPE